jgi:SAM-dependent methyltransferase
VISDRADVALPQLLELDAYRRFNPDLAGLPDPELVKHYIVHGEREGRRSNALGSRADFAALVPPGAEALEIGPFNNPLLCGERVRYFDVLTRAGLIERAQQMGLPPERTPEIDYVSTDGDLTVVDAVFDVVLSSHSIEHQTDLIAHLNTVARLLHEGGRYFVLAPDKRYCFDHYMNPSSLADVLEAHYERRTRHTLANVLSNGALSTHNDTGRHWAGDHGKYLENLRARYEATLTEYDRRKETYIDVHGWFFTPASFKAIVLALQTLGHTSFEIERIYPTRFNANEFWAVLRKRSVKSAP